MRGQKVREHTRVRLHLDDRRAQLLQLGIDLFSKHSYEDTSIDNLAEMAGISRGLLYHYFGSKRRFYIESVRAASKRLQHLTARHPALPPASRLRAAVDAHLRYVEEHGPVYVAVYGSGVSVAPEVHRILQGHREAVIRYFLRGLGVSSARPVLRAALSGWIAMVEGASLAWIAHRSVTRENLRELLIAGYIATIAKAVELDPKSVPSFRGVPRQSAAWNP